MRKPAAPAKRRGARRQKREVGLARVAIVTGGPRGIGRAVSVALKKAGYKVAAAYGGNEVAACKFTRETDIPSFKFDVANFKECEAAVKRTSHEVGPVDILINNAGITRDA